MQIRIPVMSAALFLAALVAIIGLSSSAMGAQTMRLLTTAQAKRQLRQLPYRYVFRVIALPVGDSGALAGRVIGAHSTVLHFGLALGSDPEPVWVPRAGKTNWTQGPGFVYTDDRTVPGIHEKWESGPQIHTAKQEKEANHMGVNIVEKLCKATTGKVCGI
jgi:hypothetical protein